MELMAARVSSVSLGWLAWELFVHIPSCKQPSLAVNQNYPQITCVWGKKMIHAVNFVIGFGPSYAFDLPTSDSGNTPA